MYTLEVDGLSTPLRVLKFEGHEGLSELYEWRIHVASPDANLAFSDLLGKAARLVIGSEGETPRYVHGIVRRFEHAARSAHHTTYLATLVPHAWRLLLRNNHRIFQGKSAVDVVKAVLSEAGVAPFQIAVSGSPVTREYCVQYDETDWAFVCRLLEEEGIFYYFEHGEDQVTLVLGDAPSVHQPIPGEPVLKYRPGTGALGSEEHVYRFHYGEEIRPGKVSMRDYNFKTPTVSMDASSTAEVDDDLELYHYPGRYEDDGAGATIAERTLEAYRALRASGDGHSSSPRVMPGFTFSLGDTPSDDIRDDLNQTYLVTRVEHRGEEPHSESGSEDVAPYTNVFRVIPAETPFRPLPRTPRPSVRGVQTAVVVGPGGEEIYTDEHGRVKVQFHWDRLGKGDEGSSCWVRVRQAWAGPAWGSLFIPRIGQEVVVDFIDGDPDRPLVSGAVYHASNVPPYGLPGDKTRSTLKSNSSIGGGGFNELRFEDLSGSEEIFLHGQKDWNVVILNDENQSIGHDETRAVGNDQTLEIGHDRRKTVRNDQYEVVDGNKSIKVGKNHDEVVSGDVSVTVAGSESIAIGKTSEISIGQSQEIQIGLTQTVTVALAQSTTVGAAMALSVGGSKAEAVGGSSHEQVGGDKATSVSGKYDLTVAKDVAFKVAKSRKDEVEDEHTLVIGKKWALQCGKASVTVEKNGNISIFGKDVTLKGTGPLKIEGKKLQVDSKGAVTVNASGKVQIKGSNVGLN